MEKTGQWRFTPPTHVVVALHEAIAQFEAEGGQPGRLARYTQNYHTLVDGMSGLGFQPFLDPAIQAPIIVTFHAPIDPAYDFTAFYAAVRARGFLLYPGKLTAMETFRVGCIGAIGPQDITQAVHAVRLALADLGINIVR
jgi:2-aminoethylphosphonate-pyruvate transaminase